MLIGFFIRLAIKFALPKIESEIGPLLANVIQDILREVQKASDATQKINQVAMHWSGFQSEKAKG